MAVNIFLGTGTDPTDYGDATNWSLGAVPVATDEVFFNSLSAAVDVTLNLDQSAVVLGGFYCTAGFEGTIGDKTTFLQIASPIIEIGAGDGNGSQRLNIDAGTSTASTINVISVPNSGADTNFASLRLKANNAGTDIQINGETSNVSIIDEADETGTVGDIDVIQASNVLIGRGCTYSTLSQLDGTVQAAEATGSMNIAEGSLTLEGSTAMTQIIQSGGTVNYNSTGTIADYVGRGGTLETTQSALPRTISQLTKSAGFTINRHTNVTITSDLLDADYETFIISVS